MAARRSAVALLRHACKRPQISSTRTRLPLQSRPATAAAAEQELDDLEPGSTLTSPAASVDVGNFDPLASAKARTKELPPSRYQFRSPRYRRGALHPIQPPKPSDPASREFLPGPFSLPRLEQTYISTIASDLMTLSYQHFPPGFRPPPKAPRLRSWDGPSPYHKNRPLRAPRGSAQLNLLKERITFRNVPKLTGITVHSFVKEAVSDSAALHVASMALQAITGVRCTAHQTKTSVPNWGLKKRRYASLTSDMKGEDMYHFLSKLVDVVMPRIRDYRGAKGTAGDDNGNITIGLTPTELATFPEIEVNYDSYPPQMIPGCHIHIKTSATTDRDARLLLTSFGIPFYGKHVN